MENITGNITESTTHANAASVDIPVVAALLHDMDSIVLAHLPADVRAMCSAFFAEHSAMLPPAYHRVLQRLIHFTRETEGGRGSLAQVHQTLRPLLCDAFEEAFTALMPLDHPIDAQATHSTNAIKLIEMESQAQLPEALHLFYCIAVTELLMRNLKTVVPSTIERLTSNKLMDAYETLDTAIVLSSELQRQAKVLQPLWPQSWPLLLQSQIPLSALTDSIDTHLNHLQDQRIPELDEAIQKYHDLPDQTTFLQTRCMNVKYLLDEWRAAYHSIRSTIAKVYRCAWRMTPDRFARENLQFCNSPLCTLDNLVCTAL